jgi:hypothetical protein
MERHHHSYLTIFSSSLELLINSNKILKMEKYVDIFLKEKEKREEEKRENVREEIECEKIIGFFYRS